MELLKCTPLEYKPKAMIRFLGIKTDNWFVSLLKRLKILGYCTYCREWFKYPRRFHQDTNYNKLEDNFACACKRCQVTINDNWNDLRNSLY